MVADNPQLRQAMQQASSPSDSFASQADSMLETTGKVAAKTSRGLHVECIPAIHCLLTLLASSGVRLSVPSSVCLSVCPVGGIYRSICSIGAYTGYRSISAADARAQSGQRHTVIRRTS